MIDKVGGVVLQRILFCLFLISQFWGVEQKRNVSAYWDGKYFHTSYLSRWKKRGRTIQDPAIFFSVKHMHTYGHALLDGVFPLYCMLKEQKLLEDPLVLVISVESCYSDHQTVLKIAQFMKDIFYFRDVVFLKKGDFVENLLVSNQVPLKGKSKEKEKKYFTFYEACPESFEYMLKLKTFGLRDHVVYQDVNIQSSSVRDFVDFVKKAYKIDRPMLRNRILIGNRSQLRQICNLDPLVSTFKSYGYDVVVADFEKLSMRDQILEAVQAEYLLGTYGSNLTNAIFLQPQASVVILWHKYAKYFWSRRYCIIHSAFLSAGVRLIEYDKPEYDERDVYTECIFCPEYFYREGQINRLKPDKTDLEAMVNFPGDAMSEILNVDLYIDPEDLVNILKKGSV